MKVPGSEDKKAHVKNLSGKNRPVNSKIHDMFKGWSLQPLDPGMFQLCVKKCTFSKQTNKQTKKKCTFSYGGLGFTLRGLEEKRKKEEAM